MTAKYDAPDSPDAMPCPAARTHRATESEESLRTGNGKEYQCGCSDGTRVSLPWWQSRWPWRLLGASATSAKACVEDVGDITAATPQPVEATGTSDLKIGLVTDVGTLDDKNFNEYSWLGAQEGAASIGAPSPQAIVTANSADYATNIQTLRR